MGLKKRFASEIHSIGIPRVLTVAVKLPSGAIEVITNTEDTGSKALYYLKAYDDDFKLMNNNEVQIVGYMIV